VKDLNEAISLHQESVLLTPKGHPDSPGCLNNLAVTLQEYFLQLGEGTALDEAISLLCTVETICTLDQCKGHLGCEAVQGWTHLKCLKLSDECTSSKCIPVPI